MIAPKLVALMDRIEARQVSHLVMAHKDRLVRFGFQWFERFCAEHGTESLVLNNEQLSPEQEQEQELVQDLLTIVHCFSARLYGLRNYHKKLKEALAHDINDRRRTVLGPGSSRGSGARSRGLSQAKSASTRGDRCRPTAALGAHDHMVAEIRVGTVRHDYLSPVGFSEFRRQLQYKAAMRGRRIVIAIVFSSRPKHAWRAAASIPTWRSASMFGRASNATLFTSLTRTPQSILKNEGWPSPKWRAGIRCL